MCKPTCEDTIDLNVNRLRRYGSFEKGAAHGITWTRNGEQWAQIAVQNIGSSTIRLFYWSDGKKQDYHVHLTFTPCRYGGQRPWFVCPCCHRRVGVLLLSWGRFVCRHCGGFCYQTQLEQFMGRSLIRGERLMSRIGGREDPDDPPKPKGLHWKTYWRIFERANKAFDRSWAKKLAAIEMAYPDASW